WRFVVYGRGYQRWNDEQHHGRQPTSIKTARIYHQINHYRLRGYSPLTRVFAYLAHRKLLRLGPSLGKMMTGQYRENHSVNKHLVIVSTERRLLPHRVHPSSAGRVYLLAVGQQFLQPRSRQQPQEPLRWPERCQLLLLRQETRCHWSERISCGRTQRDRPRRCHVSKE